MVELGTTGSPYLLGLTGPIACGKTTVGDMLLELGALDRIDADRVVHDLMAPETEVTRQVRARFGDGVIQPDGSVDRRRLGAIVFADPAALRALEAITHPAVRTAIRAKLASYAGRAGVVVVDAVKLLQSELLELCDAVWVVRCAPGVQAARLQTNRGMTEEAARGRLAAQPSFDHPRVTATIENSSSMEDLRQQVKHAWDSLHETLSGSSKWKIP